MSGNKKRKNPILALVLSGLLPGLGQLYNNQILKGLFFFVLIIVIGILAYEPFIYLFKYWGSIENMSPDMPQLFRVFIYSSAANVVLIASMIDAKMSADRINALTDAK